MDGAPVSATASQVATEAPPAETPDIFGAYPRLEEPEMALLARNGSRRRTRAGEVLFRAGDRHCDFLVVTEGTVAIVEGSDADGTVLGVHGPGRFLGELHLLTHEVTLVTAVVREPGEVLAVPVNRLRELVAENPALGDVILRAFLIRRSMLIRIGAGLRIIGSRLSPDTRRLREFAARNRIPHRWIDLEDDHEADALLQQLGIPPSDTPVVIWRDEQVLRNPSNAQLAEVIGLRATIPPDAVFDLLVVGAGPAGLAACVYGASEGLKTVVLDAVATGGQAERSPRIENYLGFPLGVSGSELADRAVIQAEKFGAAITVPAEALSLERQEGHYVVRLNDGVGLTSRTVVVATGARYRRLPVANVEEFEATSIYYAATELEVQACKGDAVVVVGGGNSAGQAALFLARNAAQIHLVVRHDDLGRNMSRYLVDHIERTPAIGVLRRSEVTRLLGENGKLHAVVVDDHAAGESHTVATNHLFVFIGAEPHARWLHGQVALDDHGFVLTGDAAAPHQRASKGHDQNDRTPLVLETSSPGLFAAGDVRSGSVKRVAAAVGEGAMAVRLVHEHLSSAAHSRAQ